MDAALVVEVLEALLGQERPTMSDASERVLDWVLSSELDRALERYALGARAVQTPCRQAELAWSVIDRLGPAYEHPLARVSLLLAAQAPCTVNLGPLRPLGLFGPQLLVTAVSLRDRVIHASLARALPELASIYGYHVTVIPTLSSWYSQHSTLFKIELLETVHLLLTAAFLVPLADKGTSASHKIVLLDQLEEIVGPLLRSIEPKQGWLMEKSLLEDLQYYYHLDRALESALGDRDAWRAKDLVASLRALSLDDNSIDGLELFLSPVNETSGSSDDSAVRQILELFPSYEEDFLRRCLAHERFAGDTERVIAALLEDNLPASLTARPAAPVPALPTTSARANIFNAPLSLGQLSRGGKKLNGATQAEQMDQGREFMTSEMKEEIIRRAEEESDEEEEGEAFLEDFEEVPRRGMGVRDGIGGDGEEDEMPRPAPVVRRSLMMHPADHLQAKQSPNNPITPAIATLLQSIYLKTPELFGSTSIVRRSKPRVALREQTGLDDQMLEGWRIMLERDVRFLPLAFDMLMIFCSPKSPKSSPSTQSTLQGSMAPKYRSCRRPSRRTAERSPPVADEVDVVERDEAGLGGEAMAARLRMRDGSGGTIARWRRWPDPLAMQLSSMSVLD